MRTTYRYDRATETMVEVRRSGPGMPHVMGDVLGIEPDHLDGRRDLDRQPGRAAGAQRA